MKKLPLGKIVVPVFVVVLIAVSIWMFRYQYFDKKFEGRNYTTRKHIFTDKECYFVGEFKPAELKKLALIHCAIADQ